MVLMRPFRKNGIACTRPTKAPFAMPLLTSRMSANGHWSRKPLQEQQCKPFYRSNGSWTESLISTSGLSVPRQNECERVRLILLAPGALLESKSVVPEPMCQRQFRDGADSGPKRIGISQRFAHSPDSRTQSRTVSPASHTAAHPRAGS